MVSNCLAAAIMAKLLDWHGVRIICVRNRRNRRHWQWVQGGYVHEFYAKGAAGRSRARNLLYKGEIKRVKKV